MKDTYDNWLVDMLMYYLKYIDNDSLARKRTSELKEIASYINLKQLKKPDSFFVSEKKYIENLLEKYSRSYKDTTLSIAIMTKNQEDKILETLTNTLPYCDELIIVDTGSTDRTVEKIKSVKNKKLIFYKKNWENDYSRMRNYLISLCNKSWIFFVDSDERILSSNVSINLKKMLALVDVLVVKPVVIQPKIKTPISSSGFSSVDRIIRNDKFCKYSGSVHEEIRADQEIIRLRSSLEIMNLGDLPSEVEKFGKDELYRKLTKEMIKSEPQNRRWVSQLTLPSDATLLEQKEYGQLLKQALSIDEDKNLSLDNLIDSRYTNILLEKYALVLLGMSRFDQVISLSNMALKKFPNNGLFLYTKYLSNYYKSIQSISNIFENLLLDLKTLDYKESYEIAQQDTSMLQGVVAKYMFIVGLYEEAHELLKDIDDEASLMFANKEKELLNRYFKS